MKIRSVGAELFHVDRQTDRHDEVNSRFSQFCEKRLEANRQQSITSIHTHQEIYKFLLQLYELQQTVAE